VWAAGVIVCFSGKTTAFDVYSMRNQRSEYLAKVVNEELFVGNVEHKRLDREKGHIRIQSAKGADRIERAALHQLRKKLHSLPEPMLNQARQNYMRSNDIRMRAFQERQCEMLRVVEKMIRKKTIELGLDYTKISIGGFNKGPYEMMFKAQPKKYMTHAQFVSVMRSIFQMDLSIATEQQLTLLYKSFDYEDNDQVDWRGFLYLLFIVIHAHKPVIAQLHMAFAIYSSIGTLDFQCSERVRLSDLKDIIEVPVVCSHRATIRSMIDTCWFELTQSDDEAFNVSINPIIIISLYLSYPHR
jgi:hypothetical protein